MQEIIVIAGTTASGKSSIALQLANKLNGYIINADSRQVYKEIPICTAQPVPEALLANGSWLVEGVEHYLYGFADIKDSYNIYQYQKDVKDLLSSKESEKKVPIMVGGTGLYIDSVIYNYNLNTNLQDRFSREDLQKKSLSELQEIAGNSIESLNDSDRNNPVRLIRLIEKAGTQTTKGSPLPHKYFVLSPDQDTLELNIKSRIDEMFDMGLEQQNRSVWEKYKNNLPKALNTIGFSEFIPYFSGERALEEVKELMFIHTRQYAKKQRTWFKKNNSAFFVKDMEDISSLL